MRAVVAGGGGSGAEDDDDAGFAEFGTFHPVDGSDTLARQEIGRAHV